MQGGVRSRFIGIPRSVSQQAQRLLSMDMFGGSADPLDPNDVDGCRAKIQTTDEMVMATLGPEVDQLGATVESRLISGVPVFVVGPDGVDDGD